MEGLAWSTLYNIIIPLFALGLVVFVHELGHFLVARWCGIRVLRFSIGFGPKILSFKKNETEYSVCWLFFGGYVKFAGDDLDEEDARSVKGGYYASAPWKRNLTAVAGPLMNLLFAFILYCLIFVIGKPVLIDEKDTTIGAIMENSPALYAKLEPGDRIIEIDQQKVDSWKDVINSIILSRNDVIKLRIVRDNKVLDQDVKPEMDLERGVRRIGITKMERVIVDAVRKGSPAELSKVEAGDVILSYDGKPIYRMTDLQEAIQEGAGREIIMLVNRDSHMKELSIRAMMSDELDLFLIGITQRIVIITEHPNPFIAMKMDMVNVFKTLQALLTRTVSPKGLAGPVGILKIIGLSAKFGFVFFLGILAMISVNLGILNLLPIPVLDGGHLLINGIESVRHKAIDRKTLAAIQYVFLVVLLTLIVIVTYNDIKRLSEGLFSRPQKSHSISGR